MKKILLAITMGLLPLSFVSSSEVKNISALIDDTTETINALSIENQTRALDWTKYSLNYSSQYDSYYGEIETLTIDSVGYFATASPIASLSQYLISADNIETPNGMNYLYHITKTVDVYDSIRDYHLYRDAFEFEDTHLLMYISAIDKEPFFEGDIIRMQRSSIKLTQSQLLEGITATDDYDGDLTSSITIVDGKDNYTPNWDKAGNWDVTISVSDSSGNTATTVITIRVYDDLPPIISGVQSNYLVSYNEKLSIDQILENMIITDDYTSSEQINVNIDRGQYESKWNEIGEYSITITATDAVNQTSTKVIKITVQDIDNPFFAFDQRYIYIEKNTNLSDKDLYDILIGFTEYDIAEIESYRVSSNIDNQRAGSYNAVIQLNFTDGTNYTEKLTVYVLGENVEVEDFNKFEEFLFNIGLYDAWNNYQVYIISGVVFLVVSLTLISCRKYYVNKKEQEKIQAQRTKKKSSNKRK